VSLSPDNDNDSLAVSLRAGVDAAINTALTDKRLVGAVVLISQDGRPIYRRAAGLADRENDVEMREDTIFRLASVTKPIVTIAAMRLIEQGRMGLDDPITRWLPDFRPKLPDGGEAVITIHHLLTHTAGLNYRFIDEDGPYVRAGVSDGIGEPGMLLAENLRRIASAPLLFAPGQGWRYSLAMDVLGGIIEEEMGCSLDEAVAELVMKPLGLIDTAFLVRDRDRLAAPYINASPEPELMGEAAVVSSLTGSVRFAPSRIFDPASYHSGGAGMAGTAGDVVAILETIRMGGAPLLSPETVAAMMVDQTNGHKQRVEPGSDFGFGWAVVADPEAAQVPLSRGSLQWGGVYGHSWFVDPAKKLTVVALTNTVFEGMSGRFTVDLRNAIYAAI
jgi:CubicO group peptidase (beta-lactamase class C family)